MNKVTAAFVLFLSVSVNAQNTLLSNSLDSLFKKTFNSSEPGGAILIAKEGKIIYARGFGVENIKTKKPISTKTLFNVGSISKTFVASAILHLAEERKLSLDDNLEKYFPDFKNKEIARKRTSLRRRDGTILPCKAIRRTRAFWKAW